MFGFMIARADTRGLEQAIQQLRQRHDGGLRLTQLRQAARRNEAGEIGKQQGDGMQWLAQVMTGRLEKARLHLALPLGPGPGFLEAGDQRFLVETQLDGAGEDMRLKLTL